MAHTHFSFTNPVWKRSESDKASRYFVTIERNIAQQIKTIAATQPRKGRGSVKVKVRIGPSSRSTSIFPDKQSDSYVLPIKKEIRSDLHIKEGDNVLVYIDLM